MVQINKNNKDSRDMFAYEKKYWSRGIKNVAGVDEAGRGPLAGPVYAAAVVFDEGTVIGEIDDSKKLTDKKREKLFDIIIQKAKYYNIVSVDEKTIDKINILNATLSAFDKAITGLKVLPDVAIIDGNQSRGVSVECETIVKGDALSQSIAAASILAKVSRDRYMRKAAYDYPQYKFEKNMGYGTKEHMQAIKEYGPCVIHRKTFKGVKEYVKQ